MPTNVGKGKRAVSYDMPSVKERVYDIIGEVRVVTDREIKVRLENEFFPWVVGRALNLLLKENRISHSGFPGRRKLVGISEPMYFFTVSGTTYSEIREVLSRKREIAAYVNGLLTGASPAGYHAERLFLGALEEKGFTCLGEDVSEFRGSRVRGIPGKELGNLDFIMERGSLTLGVDVKNWIRYEWATRDKVSQKVKYAKDLNVVPFIIARYVDKDTIFTQIVKKGGFVYPYRELILPSAFKSLADQAKELLGYPTIATDSLPQYKKDWLEKLIQDYLVKKESGKTGLSGPF